MKLKNEFEIVHVADEHILIPIGKQKEDFKGVVVLNEAAAFLLEEMKQDITVDDMVQLLIDKYDVDTSKAKEDIERILESISELGLLAD